MIFIYIVLIFHSYTNNDRASLTNNLFESYIGVLCMNPKMQRERSECKKLQEVELGWISKIFCICVGHCIRHCMDR